MEVKADSLSGEDLFSGSQKAVFLLCPHLMKGDGELPWVLFCKSANPIHKGFSLMT